MLLFAHVSLSCGMDIVPPRSFYVEGLVEEMYEIIVQLSLIALEQCTFTQLELVYDSFIEDPFHSSFLRFPNPVFMI